MCVDENGEVWTRVRRRRNRRNGGGDPPGDDPPGDGGDGGNPDGDPPSRREDAGRERRRRSHSRSSRSPNRLKEQNKVELPGFPQVATLSKYKADLLDAVLNCAQDQSPGVVLPWIMKVGEKGVKFEDLQEPGANFQTLDRKLAIALSKTLPQEFGRMVEVKRQRALREHKLLAGRQILWEIYRHLATSANQENLYSASDLMSIRWFGDSHKQAFMTMWEDRMSKTKGNVAVWVKTEVLEKCVKEPTDLRFQWMQYEDKHRDELNDDNALERYDLLNDMIQRQVVKERKEVNLEKMQSADKRFKEQFIKTPAPKKAPAAPAPQGKGKDKGGGGNGKGPPKGPGPAPQHSAPSNPNPSSGKPKGGKGKKGDGKGKGKRGNFSTEGTKRLCVNFLFNTCRWGGQCPYLHDRKMYDTLPEDNKKACRRLYDQLVASRSQSPASSQANSRASSPATPGKGEGKAGPKRRGKKKAGNSRSTSPAPNTPRAKTGGGGGGGPSS